MRYKKSECKENKTALQSYTEGCVSVLKPFKKSKHNANKSGTYSTNLNQCFVRTFKFQQTTAKKMEMNKKFREEEKK